MYKLLTSYNTKTNKSLELGYKTFILHLSPHTMGGMANVCPQASEGCIKGCLNTSGHGGMFKPGSTTNQVQIARKRRTQLFFTNRNKFMSDLYDDIVHAIKYCNKRNLIPTFRLNGTSDVSYESIPVRGYSNIFEAFPNVQFYDYTKVLGRFKKCKQISNYHLVFSRSEVNDNQVKQALSQNLQVAMVFDVVPSVYMNKLVLDGDAHDLIFLHDQNCIIGLKAKGRAKKDTSGFVIRDCHVE